MSTQLKISEYQTLLDGISHIYLQAQLETRQTVDHILVKAYWQIGKWIVQVEQKGNFRAKYGDYLVEHLSEDLTAKHGKGFSTSNLARMKLFFVAFSIFPALGKLNWTHYQVLSTVKDQQERNAYEKKAAKSGWSSRELSRRLKEDAVAKIAFDVPAKEGSEKRLVSPPLLFKRGKLGTYRVKVSPQIILQEDHVLIDFGFNVWRAIPSKLRNVRNKTIAQISMSANGIKAVVSTRTKKDLYFYKAYLERIVDGDTLLVNIDLGPGVWIRQRLRLNGIDAPELATKAGQKAQEFLKNLLKNIPFIILKTNQVDMYYRYLTDVFYSPNETNPNTVATRGKFLNQQLLDVGVAQRLK